MVNTDYLSRCSKQLSLQFASGEHEMRTMCALINSIRKMNLDCSFGLVPKALLEG